MNTIRTNPLERSARNLTSSLLTLFKRLIGDGVLSPGDRLPPERELAEMVGVSRSSLRQALKVLENMGVISQRVGSGTRLNPAAASILTEPLQFLILLDGITFDELMEARMIVEPQLAARAAERATPEDLNFMRQAIVRMDESKDDVEQFVASDLEFHQALYDAAGNRVCAMLFTVVHQSLEELLRYTHVLTAPERTNRFHRRIFAAIRRRDPEVAKLRMREHLEDARTLIDRAEASQTRSSIQGSLGGLLPLP